MRPNEEGWRVSGLPTAWLWELTAGREESFGRFLLFASSCTVYQRDLPPSLIGDKSTTCFVFFCPTYSTFRLLLQGGSSSLSIVFSPRALLLFSEHIQSSPGSYRSSTHWSDHMIPLTEIHGIKMLLMDESFHEDSAVC